MGFKERRIWRPNNDSNIFGKSINAAKDFKGHIGGLRTQTLESEFSRNTICATLEPIRIQL